MPSGWLEEQRNTPQPTRDASQDPAWWGGGGQPVGGGAMNPYQPMPQLKSSGTTNPMVQNVMQGPDNMTMVGPAAPLAQALRGGTK